MSLPAGKRKREEDYQAIIDSSEAPAQAGPECFPATKRLKAFNGEPMPLNLAGTYDWIHDLNVAVWLFLQSLLLLAVKGSKDVVTKREGVPGVAEISG